MSTFVKNHTDPLGAEGHAGREADWMMHASQEPSGVAGDHGSWEEAGKDSRPEFSEGAWPCRLLDFKLLASRTAREYVSAVLSHSVYSNLWWQP